MVKELVQNIEDLKGCEIIKSDYDSFAKKAERRLKDNAYGIYNRLARGEKVPYNAKVVGQIIEGGLKKARTLKEAVNKYIKENPEEGEDLQKLIDETRDQHEIYLNFGLKGDYDLPNATYLRVFKDLGIKPEDSHLMLRVTNDIVEHLRKKKVEKVRSILIDLDKKKKEKKQK